MTDKWTTHRDYIIRYGSFNDQGLTLIILWNCSNSQLFGEEDPDQDVSPDTEDPELTGKHCFLCIYDMLKAMTVIFSTILDKPFTLR